MNSTGTSEILKRLQAALDAACSVAMRFTPGAVDVKYKSADNPVTAADHAINHVLREMLVADGEGWLSEETTDNPARLSKNRLWVVDPLDGTKEFVAGIPEWCISIGFVENGKAVAGGICNPSTREFFLGSRYTGVLYNGKPARVSERRQLRGALVLGSRSEFSRGEWQPFQDGSINLRSVGSVAYKLARVAAGLADATWTLVPKHEWDVAGGTALVEAAGGVVRTLDNMPVRFNSANPKLSGLMACGSGLQDQIVARLGLGQDVLADTQR